MDATSKPSARKIRMEGCRSVAIAAPGTERPVVGEREAQLGRPPARETPELSPSARTKPQLRRQRAELGLGSTRVEPLRGAARISEARFPGSGWVDRSSGGAGPSLDRRSKKRARPVGSMFA